MDDSFDAVSTEGPPLPGAIGSMFSGIGGLELGLERAGVGKVVWQAEVDPNASSVLARQWPGIPNLGDVSQVDWTTVEPVDVLCGGVPCQPASTAGKRRGRKDDRWLWPEMRRAVAGLSPRLVIVENVPGLLSVDGGEAFGGIVADLVDLGYEVAWGLVAASDLGCCHRRLRLFVVASQASLPWSGHRCARIWDGRVLSEQLSLFDDHIPVHCPRAGVARGDGVEMLAASPWAPSMRAHMWGTDDDDLDNWLGCGERPTSEGGENDCGMPLQDVRRLLPPPTVMDAKRRGVSDGSASKMAGLMLFQVAESMGAEMALRLLPTPQARDGSHGGGQAKRYSDPARSNNLDDAVLALLPTPTTSDANGVGVHGDGAPDLRSVAALLPTPTASDARSARNSTANRRKVPPTGVHAGDTLSDVVAADRFGEYAPAVARWAGIRGVEPPAPTETGARGARRLNSDFVRWMMGFPGGWDGDLVRTRSLHCYGNAVVPQVAEHVGRVVARLHATTVAAAVAG